MTFRAKVLCWLLSVNEVGVCLTKNITFSNTNDIVNQVSGMDYGEHLILIYPDLSTLREFYLYYVKRAIEKGNGAVLLAPCYETTGEARQILEGGSCLNASKHESEGTLKIIDSMEAYFGKGRVMDSIYDLVSNAKSTGKAGLSSLADTGCFLQRNALNELVDVELSLPTRFDIPYKRICIYHRKDFDRLTEEQKQKLINHHGATIRLQN